MIYRCESGVFCISSLSAELYYQYVKILVHCAFSIEQVAVKARQFNLGAPLVDIALQACQAR